ncbi:hypothetical protein IFM89_013742, partial [Coptis chinensis]
MKLGAMLGEVPCATGEANVSPTVDTFRTCKPTASSLGDRKLVTVFTIVSIAAGLTVATKLTCTARLTDDAEFPCPGGLTSNKATVPIAAGLTCTARLTGAVEFPCSAELTVRLYMEFSVIGVFCYNGGALSFHFGLDSSIDVVMRKIATVEIKVNVCMSSMSSCSGASRSRSSGSSSYLIGGERFALGAPEFRCKFIEYSIVSGYKYELIKNDDFRVTTKCAYATTHEKFEEHMAEFNEIGGDVLSNFLNRVPYEYWANAYFCGARHVRWNSMKMMKMASSRRMECKNWKSFICPKIEAKLLERTERARSVTVTKSDDHVFEVDMEKHKHRVDLLRRFCTCNKWDIDGFPCRHAIA